MERGFLVTLRFDGRPFCGWQVQQNGLSVMEVFQQALASVVGCRPDVKGCSRTDAGVHALGFCVSFTCETALPCERLCAALNNRLPRTVAAVACCEVAPGFHARYAAEAKRYLYRILDGPVRDPFWEGLSWYLPPRSLDVALLQREADAFVGTHDFSAFCSIGDGAQDKTRTIHAFTVSRVNNLLELRVTGDGFLYNMVRIMVGTLADIARGIERLPPGCIPALLAGRDRAASGMTAPATGLYLEEVFYPPDQTITERS